MSELIRLTEAIIRGDREEARALTGALMEADAPAQEILDAMTAAMDDVGGRFQRHEMYVPEMLIAARAMKESVALLEPRLVEAGIRPLHTAVVGTVQGDLHDIGKNLVAMMWRGANINVIDLGTNVSPEQFVAAAKQHEAHLVGLSALLTTTMPSMRGTIQALRGAGLDGAKVLVGGAPVTQAFADEVGADGYAPDAGSAVNIARRLMAG